MGDLQTLEADWASPLTRAGSAAHEASDLSMLSSWRSAWARYQGRSHAASGVPCQDQVLALTFPSGTVVGALADGAGSARWSHYGAEVALRAAAQLVEQQFDRIFRATNNLQTIRVQVIDRLQSVLTQFAAGGLDVSASDRDRMGLPPHDSDPRVACELTELASTLLLVAVKGERFVALHLGDGVLGVQALLRGGRAIARPLGRPDNGEHTNETTFVTSANAADALRIYRGRLATKAQTISGFILMSDGPETSLYQKPAGMLAPACSKLIEACRSLPSDVMQIQLEATLRDVIVPRTHDDCSLVLMAAPDAGREGPES